MARDLDDATFDFEHFPGLVYHPDGHPDATSLVFRSGAIVCTGATSVEGVHAAIHTTVEALRELGISGEAADITVENIVTSGDLGEGLNLEAIAIGLGLEDVEYEPEQFPGLVYRSADLAVVVLLFGTGKIVITGGTVPEDADAAVELLVSRLTDLGLLS